MKTKKVDYFEVLRSINKNPDASQREMAGKLGFSLGKLNYCLKLNFRIKVSLKYKIFKTNLIRLVI